jgi:small subunit ribosomal protein S1
MATHTIREDYSEQPPELEEGYWKALLAEGEFARSVEPGSDDIVWDTPTIQDEAERPLIQPEMIPEDHPENHEASDWTEIERVMDADETLSLKVIGYNRGGLLVEWRSLRGFVPASQLVEFPIDGEQSRRRHNLVERVGDTLELRIIELDAEKNRLIFSERAAQVRAGTREQILADLEPGDIVHGSVTNLCDFGAFVDLGGVEGLIHISEMSWGRVTHPADMLERGEEVQVYVLGVDPEQARVALSLKRLHPDPWATVDQRYEVGEIVEGRITNVVDFGAFACIEEGLEGLVHFSELAEGHFLHPRNVVAEGDVVQARIISIDGKARRLGLSLRLS